MKYIILFFVSALSLLPAQANPVLIQPRFTNAFRFTATDAWNIDLQFQAAQSLNVYIIAEISQSGNAVATLKSNSILLNPGVQSFTSVSLSTAQLHYLSQAIADIESVTGTFPAGNYKICYSAQCVSQDCDGLGATALYNESPQCFEFIIEPPTPLLLAFPEDRAELDWPRPTFNWIPPAPLSSVNGFNYLYTLVEKQKEQTCNDAIVRNRPLYKQSGIDIPTLPYPAELNDLDTGKVYCWKVDGLVGEIPVAQSEVWEFRLKSEKKVVDTFRYARLLPKIEAGYTSIGSSTVVFFIHEGRYKNEELSIQITDDNGRIVPVQPSSDILKSEANRPGESTSILQAYGDNKYALLIDQMALPTGVYLITATSTNNTQYFLRIKIE